MRDPDVKELIIIEKDLNENYGLVLMGHKTKEEMSWWEQVDEILNKWGTLWNKMFFKVVVSKWNVVFAYNVVKMMLPHDCHPLLEKKTIVTKATSLVIIVHPCCNSR